MRIEKVLIVLAVAVLGCKSKLDKTLGSPSLEGARSLWTQDRVELKSRVAALDVTQRDGWSDVVEKNVPDLFGLASSNPKAAVDDFCSFLEAIVPTPPVRDKLAARLRTLCDDVARTRLAMEGFARQRSDADDVVKRAGDDLNTALAELKDAQTGSGQVFGYNGIMIAALSDHRYEVSQYEARIVRNSYCAPGDDCSGRMAAGISGDHDILETTKTRFTSQGEISICVRLKGRESVKVNGFDSQVAVYEEVDDPNCGAGVIGAANRRVNEARASLEKAKRELAAQHLERDGSSDHLLATSAVLSLVQCIDTKRADCLDAATPVPKSPKAGSSDTSAKPTRTPASSGHDFSNEGVPLIATVPSGATTSTRATGKGPTIHAQIDWPSKLVTEQGRQVLDAPSIDITEGVAVCPRESAPTGAAVDKDESANGGTRRILSYRQPDGRVGAVVCDQQVGYVCRFDAFPAALAVDAMAVCLSVQRSGSRTTGGVNANAVTEPPLTQSSVEQFLATQVTSFRDVGAFVDAFSDSAITFFPGSLTPFEGTTEIANGFREAWGPISASTGGAALPATIGVFGSTALVTTEWRITQGTSTPFQVRVTEVIESRAGVLKIVAAHFSTSPRKGAPGLGEPPPRFATSTANAAGGLLVASPVDLATLVHDAPWTSAVGSDENELATGTVAVRKLLASWKNVNLELVGDARIVEGNGYSTVFAFARWRTSKPVLFRVLGVFLRIDGPNPHLELATVHYSEAVPLRGP